FDYFVYFSFALISAMDFLSKLSKSASVLVALEFLIIACLSVYCYFLDDRYLSINKMLSIFLFLFCYYTPFHQYLDGVNIHNFAVYSDSEYIYANFLIIIFISIYIMVKKNEKKTINIFLFKTSDFSISTGAMLLLSILCIVCLIYLYSTNDLISLIENNESNMDSLSVVIKKIVRFFPVSALLLMIFGLQTDRLCCTDSVKIVSFVIIGICSTIIFFPINGAISRYLLFGTYITIIVGCKDCIKHNSMVVIGAFVGFYFIFPAFNFFKYNDLTQLSEFEFGGFDANFTDYDAYQMFLQSIRYVSDHGLTWGANLITALLNFVPRSIWKGKAYNSGQVICEYYNKSFTNTSCPIFAELYLSFGIVGIIIGTYLFARLIQLLENGYKSSNMLQRGCYCISVGIIFAFLRGSLLSMSSFWTSLIVSYALAYFICYLFGYKK
ncbi:MAG: oligosaccharide repeat unit polymerase, partial [Lachnospiraceae bacterium]|nr:oligosaccharide repeat unit polymerase [Lachnospiraceae bacterium]